MTKGHRETYLALAGVLSGLLKSRDLVGRGCPAQLLENRPLDSRSSREKFGVSMETKGGQASAVGP